MEYFRLTEITLVAHLVDCSCAISTGSGGLLLHSGLMDTALQNRERQMI